jgi:hypothetical protein
MVCRGDTITDDPSITYTFNVPKAPAKAKPGGWGFLVLTFDRAITSATFVFPPDCSDPTQNPEGFVSDDMKTVQIGPGSYGLGQTGAADPKGGNYGTLSVTINYPDPAAPPPMIVFKSGDNTPLSFWQFKNGGFTFNSEPLVNVEGVDPAVNRQDQALSPSDLAPMPSPFWGGLVCCGLLLATRFARRGRVNAIGTPFGL